mgnify:FL=1
MLTTQSRKFLIGAAVALTAGFGANAALAQEVNLSLVIWDPAQRDGVQLAVDAFEAANPDIKVTLEQVPSDQYYTKLDAALGAGEGPDVMWQSSRASYYVAGGALQPLDEYIARDGVSLDAYNQTIAGLYNIDGKQYGMPKDFDAWTMVYNANVFEELGGTPPTADWIWDDMVRIAEDVKAKQAGGADIPLYVYYNWNNGVASLVHSLGGTVIKDGKGYMSSEEGVMALNMMRDLQDQGLITKVADSADLNPVSALISGTVAIAEIPSWNLSLLSRADVPEGSFHVLHLPAVNGAWMTDTNGLSYVMNAHSDHKEEAWELIKFLTSDEGAVLHAQGGAGLPANAAPEASAAFVEANSALVGLEDALAAQQQLEERQLLGARALGGLRARVDVDRRDALQGVRAHEDQLRRA